MGRPDNRLQFMERLGAKQANIVWAWCGVDELNRRVYFSLWTDLTHTGETGKSYLVQAPHWGVNEHGHRSPARNDHDQKLDLVLKQGYEAFGYFVEAKDVNARPREIAKTLTSFVVRLELQRLEDGCFVGKIKDRIEVR